MGKNIEGEQIFFWTIFSIKEVHSERVRDGSKYSFGHFLVIPNMLFDHYISENWCRANDHDLHLRHLGDRICNS